MAAWQVDAQLQRGGIEVELSVLGGITIDHGDDLHPTGTGTQERRPVGKLRFERLADYQAFRAQFSGGSIAWSES